MSISTTSTTEERYIFVIDPAQHTCELSCFNALIQRSPHHRFQYFAPAIFGIKDLLESTIEPAGLIILGSGASVYDGSSWQSELNRWRLPRISAGIATLGICYGHQLLAHLFGGKVTLGFGGEKKKGQREIILSSDNDLFTETKTGTVIVSHREIVSDPGEFKIVGSSHILDTEVIAHPTLPVWGFQAHVEATPGFLTNNSIPVHAAEHDFEFGHSILDQFVHISVSNTSGQNGA